MLYLQGNRRTTSIKLSPAVVWGVGQTDLVMKGSEIASHLGGSGDKKVLKYYQIQWGVVIKEDQKRSWNSLDFENAFSYTHVPSSIHVGWGLRPRFVSWAGLAGGFPNTATRTSTYHNHNKIHLLMNLSFVSHNLNVLHTEIHIHIECACYCSKLSYSCTRKWAKNKRAGGGAVIPSNWLLHVVKGGESFKKVTKIMFKCN